MVEALNETDAHDDEPPSTEAAANAKRERDRQAITAKRAALRRSGKKARTYYIWPEDSENAERYMARLNQRRAAERARKGLPV